MEHHATSRHHDEKRQAAWVDYLRDTQFTVFLTFKYPTPEINRVPGAFEQRCIWETGEFFRRLDFRLFSHKAKRPHNMRLRRVVYFENKTKSGDACHFHAHALVCIPDSYRDAFYRFAPAVHRKIYPSSQRASIFEMDVYDQTKLVKYVSKFSHSEFEVLAELM